MNGPSTPVRQFLDKLKEQVAFKEASEQGSIRWYIDWYRKRIPSRQKWFRGVGSAIVVITVSLPFIAFVFSSSFGSSIVTNTYKDVPLQFVAWVLAVLGALNAFLQLQPTWQGYTVAQSQLVSAWWEWEVSRDAAEVEPDQKNALSMATAAAVKLVNKASQVIHAETGAFFANIPQTPTGEPRPGERPGAAANGGGAAPP